MYYRQLEMDLADQRSRAAGIAFDPSEDQARQEYKEAQEVTHLLRKFGLTDQLQPSVDVDYDLDLLQAYQVRDQARDVWRALSPELKAKFPTVQSMLDAAADGRLNVVQEGAFLVEALPTPPGASSPVVGANTTREAPAGAPPEA